MRGFLFDIQRCTSQQVCLITLNDNESILTTYQQPHIYNEFLE